MSLQDRNNGGTGGSCGSAQRDPVPFLAVERERGWGWEKRLYQRL